MDAALSITELLLIQPLSMSGQHNIGCDHEPKCVVTYKGNIDKYRNDCEQGDNKRNYMDAENVEHCNSRRHVCYLRKPSREQKVCLFVKNHKAKQIADRIFAQQGH